MKQKQLTRTPRINKNREPEQKRNDFNELNNWIFQADRNLLRTLLCNRFCIWLENATELRILKWLCVCV